MPILEVLGVLAVTIVPGLLAWTVGHYAFCGEVSCLQAGR